MGVSRRLMPRVVFTTTSVGNHARSESGVFSLVRRGRREEGEEKEREEGSSLFSDFFNCELARWRVIAGRIETNLFSLS